MIRITLHDSAESLAGKPGEDYVLLITEDQVPALPRMREKLQGHAVSGAVVPYLLADRRVIAEGIACLALPRSGMFAQVLPMTADTAAVARAIGGRDFASLLLFADGLSRHLDDFVDALGGAVRDRDVLGTGVGTKDFRPVPVVFDAAGLRADAALLVGTGLRLRIAARHGWEPIHGPLVVTRAEGNVLHELNGEPAFNVYRRILAEQEGAGIRPDNFLDVARSYPFGIASSKRGEFIVRDTFAGGGIDQAFLFDCISRVMFLEDDFAHELAGVCEGAGEAGPRIFGVTSVGEITNAGYGRLEVLNKTALLGAVQGV